LSHLAVRFPLAAVLVLCPAVAAADNLTSARDQPLREVSHAVAVTVADGIATYKVQRVFANPGKLADEARLAIQLPYGGAATGLRIRARDRWYDGELMEATRAEKLYQELTGVGRWEPKDPALLYWAWADQLRLRVFPVLPGATSTVEYTLTVPTRYQGGQVHLAYPRPTLDAGTNLAPPVVTVQPAWGDATTAIVLDGARIAPGAPVVLVEPPEPAALAGIERIEGHGYAASAIEVPDVPAARERYAQVTVTLDLEHTYRSDLEIELYPPRGEPLQVFGGGGGGDNDVRGAFPLTLAPGTPIAGTWRLVVSDGARLDTGTLTAWKLAFGDGKRLTVAADDVPLFVPDAPEGGDGGQVRFALAPPVIDTVAARLGRVVASPRRAFTRVELDAAPILRPLPVKAQVVFAVDASHSLGADGIAEQLALIGGYLTHVPDAEVEVVVYRRKAERLWNRFVPARNVPAALTKALSAGRLAPGNGSALDEGARVAAAALAGRRGPLRVVITTDERLRGRWANADGLTALAPLPAAAVVHVVKAVGEGGEVTMERDDQLPLAPLALSHRGIAAWVRGLASDDKHLADRVLGLVRPTRIDGLALVGLDLSGTTDGEVPAVLDEGAGVRVVVGAATAPSRIELTGMIWGDKFRRVVTVDERFSRAAAAWVFGEDDHGDLTADEMMTVAMMGRAVSPVTSYLATEPGVRPSTIGLETEGTGSGGGSGFGIGGLGARGGGFGPPVDPARLLGAAVDACVKRHRPAAGWSVALDLETTGHEVVDVVPGAGADTAVGTCIVEAAWALALPPSFAAERARYPLTFR
jgi:hypothetical protein